MLNAVEFSVSRETDLVMNPVFSRILNSSSLELSDEMLRKLWGHWQLVREWNSRVNLTSIRDDEEAAWYHYRDSIAVADHLPAGSVVDMGSGAGFPGIPLAIILPQRAVTLVEPRRKRVSFLRVAAGRLGLRNLEITMGRSNDTPSHRFAALVTRATFSDDGDLNQCLKWVKPGGAMIAFRSEDSASLSQSTRQVSYQLGEYQRRFDIIDLDDE